MTLKYASRAAKELVLQLVLDSIEQKKKSLYLQEIIDMARKEVIWNRLLAIYFEAPADLSACWTFSKN